MKIRNGFVSNSSSSSFLVRVDSDYFRMIQKEEGFHYKPADNLGRGTGVYDDVDDFISELDREQCYYYPDGIYEYLYRAKMKNEKLAIVMISDEEMGGTLSYPSDNDYLLEWEYH